MAVSLQAVQLLLPALARRLVAQVPPSRRAGLLLALRVLEQAATDPKVAADLAQRCRDALSRALET